MAQYLIEQRLAAIPIAAWPAPHAEAVLPYLPVRRLYYPGIRAYGSYMKWDRAYEQGLAISADEVLERTEQAFPEARDLLLLTNQPIEGAAEAGFTLIHAVAGDVIQGDEQYLLYRRSRSG
jgi:hypothetical protein